jgi:hypothetical protein
MESSDDITSRILLPLSTLGPGKQNRALNELIGKPIKSMSIYRILEIRHAIVTSLDPDLPIVAAALNLIDGQVALREIAPGEGWR